MKLHQKQFSEIEGTAEKGIKKRKSLKASDKKSDRENDIKQNTE
jgi:hypothetical protein